MRGGSENPLRKTLFRAGTKPNGRGRSYPSARRSNFCATAFILIFRDQRTSSIPIRQRQRILVAGILISPLLLLVFSFLPELVAGSPWLDYTWTLPALLILPLSIGYAVRRGELGRVDFLLSRSLAYGILTAAFLSLYLVLFWILALVPMAQKGQAFISAAVAVSLAVLFSPVRGALLTWMDRLFYGGWYDYRTVVRETSQSLSQTLDLDQLSSRLMSIARLMRFQSAAFFWPDGSMLLVRRSFGLPPGAEGEWSFSGQGRVAHYLTKTASPCLREMMLKKLRSSSNTAALAEEEIAPLSNEQFHLWVPLVSRETLRGVLVLGRRQANEQVVADDLDILATLGVQAAVAAENVMLLNTLRSRLAEVEQVRDEFIEVQRKLVESQENERLRLAREVHDGPLQYLYAVHMQLGVLAEEGNAEQQNRIDGMTADLLHVIGELRDINRTLRPPVLDSFGVEAAIRSHVARIQRSHHELDIQVDLMHDGQLLPESMRLALFRVCQESLQNIIRHAGASSVIIRFLLNDDHVFLEVQDDGYGFQIAPRWSQLASQGHLGLVGISERVNALGGQLEVISVIGEGTTVRVTVPYPPGVSPEM